MSAELLSVLATNGLGGRYSEIHSWRCARVIDCGCMAALVADIESVTKTDTAAERADSWRDGFRSGWEASGEGYNGEYPDEGKRWEESAGYRAMICAEAVTE